MRAYRKTRLIEACKIEALERRVFLSADPPTSLTASPVRFEDTTLNWTAPSSGAPDQYRVYVSDDDQTFTFLDAPSGSVTTFIHHDILTGAGQRRYYEVTAVKNSEESVPTPSVYPLTAQDQAVLLKADVSSVGAGELTISWEPNPRFSSFAISSRRPGNWEWEPRDTVTGTSWTDSDDIDEGQDTGTTPDNRYGNRLPDRGDVVAPAR